MTAACAGAASSATAPGAGAAPPGASGVVASNVRFEDYAGSEACARCHAEYVARFVRSPMHRMTRHADGAEVRAPFDGATFAFHDDEATLSREGDARFVSVRSRRHGDGVYRVTKVIGGHHREDFAGVAVAVARRDAKPLPGAEEVILPVSFVYETQKLRYKGYSVMVKERDGLKVGPVWSRTCIFCHNTAPHLSTVLGGLAHRRAPYQGQVVDPLLPASLRATYAVTDASAMQAALADEITRLGGRPSATPTPEEALSATRARFGERHLVEVGIGCEACHLGSAEHVRNPRVLPSLEARTPAFEVRLPAKVARDAEAVRAARIDRACARCHQVLFSGYEHTWEGGLRSASPGGSNINSGEARDMMLGACASRLSCVECHDPHAPDATARLRATASAEQDRLCTRCHEGLTDAVAVRAHTHHEPSGEGARCMSCHMPKKTMSLDGGLSRYHRIGSPSDPARVLGDRPLECALCHADKSVRVLAETMERWWRRGVPYDRGVLEALYGDLDANVLLATAQRGKPHEQAVAFDVLGRHDVPGAVKVLEQNLQHPYPIVAGYAERSLERLRR